MKRSSTALTIGLAAVVMVATMGYVVAIDTGGSAPTNTPVNAADSKQTQQNPQITVGDVNQSLGSSGTTDIRLSSVPDGLLGYRITVQLDNPSVANITDASVPGTFKPSQLRSVDIAEDKNSVIIKGTDAARNVSPGDTDVLLGTLTVNGTAPGSTDVSVDVTEPNLVQDDQTPPNRLTPPVETGTVTIEADNESPSADAGPDQSVGEGASVSLDATDSSDPDDSDLDYTWTQTDGPPVTLQSEDTATPSFTAPAVNQETTLTFEVEVSDDNGESDTDTVTVSVSPSAPPNQSPTADAGANQTVDEEETVDLSADGSSDPDGDTLSYTWTQTSGPDISLTDATSKRPSFTAPDVDQSETLIFEVSVSDGDSFATDTVGVTVQPVAENQPPVADAGDDETVDEETTLELSGEGSSDPDGDELTYNWTLVDGPSVNLDGSTTSTPEFVSPSVSTDTTLTFVLNVSDGDTNATDRVNVTVEPVFVNDAPDADAGSDQTVNEETTVELSGDGSTDPDDDSLSYTWTQTEGPDISLQDSGTANPSFTAPTVDTTTTLVFELTVSDGDKQDTDTVSVTVESVSTNQPPNADAGEDKTVDEETLVDLSAESSTDPNDDTLTYSWSQTEGPSVSLQGANTAEPTFTAPTVDEETVLTFGVTVSDGEESATDTVEITVQPVTEESPPVADAGSDKSVDEETTVELTGEGSSDPNGDALDYDWTQLDGPAVTLQNADTVAPTFTAPTVDSPTTLTFEVTVSDGSLEDSDTVEVTVQPVANNQPPTAAAGSDQTVTEEAAVDLTGEGSDDPNGDSLDYEWTQTSGPKVSLQDAGTASPSFTAPTVEEETTLTFELTVSDGSAQDSDTVSVTVKPETEEPVYYQVDFVEGEPLENLGPEDSDNFYSDQERLIQYLHGSTEEPVTRRGRPDTLNESTDECIDDQNIVVEDGTAKVTFTVADGCTHELSLVSYTKPEAEWSRETADEQEFVDSSTDTFGSGTHTLTVELPEK